MNFVAWNTENKEYIYVLHDYNLLLYVCTNLMCNAQWFRYHYSLQSKSACKYSYFCLVFGDVFSLQAFLPLLARDSWQTMLNAQEHHYIINNHQVVTNWYYGTPLSLWHAENEKSAQCWSAARRFTFKGCFLALRWPLSLSWPYSLLPPGHISSTWLKHLQIAFYFIFLFLSLQLSCPVGDKFVSDEDMSPRPDQCPLQGSQACNIDIFNLWVWDTIARKFYKHSGHQALMPVFKPGFHCYIQNWIYTYS